MLDDSCLGRSVSVQCSGNVTATSLAASLDKIHERIGILEKVIFSDLNEALGPVMAEVENRPVSAACSGEKAVQSSSLLVDKAEAAAERLAQINVFVSDIMNRLRL